jgi:hypothetical protein
MVVLLGVGIMKIYVVGVIQYLLSRRDINYYYMPLFPFHDLKFGRPSGMEMVYSK